MGERYKIIKREYGNRKNGCEIPNRMLKKQGSMTVEAALVLPVFLFLMLNLLSIMEMLYLDIRIDAALSEVGREMATYAYVADVLTAEREKEGEKEYVWSEDEEYPEEGNKLIRKAQSVLLAQGYARERMIGMIGRDYLDASMIVGGSNGLVLFRSDVMEEDETIDLIVTYRLRPWFDLYEVWEKPFMKRCYIKGFTGYIPRDGISGEEVCYITADSEVYHITRECTHLKLSISSVDFDILEECRNLDGSKYKPCEKCIGKGIEYERVYIALQGDRYHSTLACSGLKRTVYVIPLSEVGERRPCLRCGT